MKHFAGIPDLSKEASAIFIWCLTQSPECYKQWVGILFLFVFCFPFFFSIVLLHMFIEIILLIFKYHLLSYEYSEQDNLYPDNLDASVIVLKKLSDEWKEHSVKHASLDPLRETLKSFREKVTIFRYERMLLVFIFFLGSLYDEHDHFNWNL